MSRHRSKSKSSKHKQKKSFSEKDIANYYDNLARQDNSVGANKKTFNINDMKYVNPLTKSQKEVFYYDGMEDNLLLKGTAGTGKTFIAMYLALRAILDPENEYDRLVIVRSTVPVRDQGHLPGDANEKSSIYEQPYSAICDELFNYKKSYENLKNSGYIEFISTSYIRGITLKNCIVILDEVQNLNYDEMRSVITRAGSNSKYILCGDTKQTDHKLQSDRKALDILEKVIAKMNCFGIVKFGIDDIVRSGLVRQFIIAEESLGI